MVEGVLRVIVDVQLAEGFLYLEAVLHQMVAPLHEVVASLHLAVVTESTGIRVWCFFARTDSCNFPDFLISLQVKHILMKLVLINRLCFTKFFF